MAGIGLGFISTKVRGMPLGQMGQIENLKIEDSAICLRALEIFTMASGFSMSFASLEVTGS